ncbi:MAG: GIY-YIG nuclease family protein [Sphingorhabdus sp.]
MKAGYVYIMANKRNGTIYIGATSDLPQRVWQHKQGDIPGFTKRYRCRMLVWHQCFENLHDARQQEIRMKAWKRRWKMRVIEELNPNWNGLYGDLQ